MGHAAARASEPCTVETPQPPPALQTRPVARGCRLPRARRAASVCVQSGCNTGTRRNPATNRNRDGARQPRLGRDQRLRSRDARGASGVRDAHEGRDARLRPTRRAVSGKSSARPRSAGSRRSRGQPRSSDGNGWAWQTHETSIQTVCGKSAAEWLNFALGKNPQSGRIGGGGRRLRPPRGRGCATGEKEESGAAQAASTARHSLAHARHDSMHALHGSCRSACFLHSASQSLHASSVTLASAGR